MRRSDRAITAPQEIDRIIASCHCMRLGFWDQGSVYIVPLNFGYTGDLDHRVFYFHSAKEGRKVDLAAQNPTVGFELDSEYQLQEGETACDYSARFQSVIGTGTLSIVTDLEEKKAGLTALMTHSTPHQKDWQFSDEMANSVAVMKLEVTQLTCKRRA